MTVSPSLEKVGKQYSVTDGKLVVKVKQRQSESDENVIGYLLFIYFKINADIISEH